jgi:hypothetical protein
LKVGKKSNSLDFARWKIQRRSSRTRRIVLENVVDVCFNGVDLRFGWICKAMLGRTEFFGNRSAHTDCKTAKKGVIIQERTFLESVGFCLANGTDGGSTRIMRTEFVDNQLVMLVELKVSERSGRIGRRTKHGANVAMIGISGFVACGRWVGWCGVASRAIRVGEIVRQSDGERTGMKQVLFGRILTIKTRDLGELLGLLA